MANPFIPKQVVVFDGKLLQELQGDVSDAIARDVLRSDLPPLKSDSVVHDNGCGYGAVTMAVMQCSQTDAVRIEATDINPGFMAQLQGVLAANPSWPVHVREMDACALTFADNTFDLSWASFIFTSLEDDVSAASHMLRTLKPGGTGIISVWKDMPWHAALQDAHHKTRGENEPMAPFLSLRWYKKEKLEQVTRDAGWKNVKFLERDAWLNLGPDLKRWATIAWSFLATPVGGWKEGDEDRWEEAIDSIVKGLQQLGDWYQVEDGIHKIRMVADIAMVQK
ncbi:S-adenosyl-L-methionine-dependent methyltransferase [Xylariomycetidae sp. FL2044]|nr:S-adenosyl-L-methionine-dependent methyltransferase [Xylariomycetidae sp. FL2044]